MIDELLFSMSRMDDELSLKPCWEKDTEALLVFGGISSCETGEKELSREDFFRKG
jgi:hypothetical protein